MSVGKNMPPRFGGPQRSLTVLSSVIHTLTLLAFSAHAVFGCCGHHQHASQNACCQSHRERVAAEDNNKQASVCSHYGCNHAGQGEPLDEEVSLPPIELPDGNSIANVEAQEAQCCSGIPCKHSSGCNEARCTYVSSDERSTDLSSNIDLVIGIVYNLIANTSLTVPTVSQNEVRVSGGPSSLTASNRCARLQSWQV